MQRRLLAFSCLVLALLLVGGCASPHYLETDPRVSGDLPRSGNGQQVTVNVVDGRDSDVLGTRSGAANASATITVYAHELIPKLQAQAENALQRMGFSPTRDEAEGRPSLTLTLDRLGYGRGDDQPVLGNARLEAVFIAKAVNGGTTYTGSYTARREQSYVVRPGEAANTKMVNQVLSNALARTFHDEELGRLLAR
ncbi:YajG family lipoprotein [Aidingimonas lacisalsi]|uniref:YajG family lipoprotein n=1 Tax=Aidingimonas lacisalsi TaxID=2604086 RepID=UPI0011D1B353|nr:YajG family lipoprotein [Aidingimonas lacisalsi]